MNLNWKDSVLEGKGWGDIRKQNKTEEIRGPKKQQKLKINKCYCALLFYVWSVLLHSWIVIYDCSHRVGVGR